MPTYRALEKGYHDDEIREKNTVFSSPIMYPRTITKKGKKVEVGMPSWLVRVDDNQSVPQEYDRPTILKNAIRKMVMEDPKREGENFHGKELKPSIESLEKATPLRDITHEERDLAFRHVMLPPSGTTPLE